MAFRIGSGALDCGRTVAHREDVVRDRRGRYGDQEDPVELEEGQVPPEAVNVVGAGEWSTG